MTVWIVDWWDHGDSHTRAGVFASAELAFAEAAHVLRLEHVGWVKPWHWTRQGSCWRPAASTPGAPQQGRRVVVEVSRAEVVAA